MHVSASLQPTSKSAYLNKRIANVCVDLLRRRVLIVGPVERKRLGHGFLVIWVPDEALSDLTVDGDDLITGQTKFTAVHRSTSHDDFHGLGCHAAREGQRSVALL